jgi:hypothetical protein
LVLGHARPVLPLLSDDVKRLGRRINGADVGHQPEVIGYPETPLQIDGKDRGHGETREFLGEGHSRTVGKHAFLLDGRTGHLLEAIAREPLLDGGAEDHTSVDWLPYP